MSQQPSVLVVDDESSILDTLRILLRKEGYEITTAQGGKAGLEQIRSGNHAIVLTDVRMPQVSGLDILQAAKDQDPETPVILMTAQASLQTAIQAVTQGAFRHPRRMMPAGCSGKATPCLVEPKRTCGKKGPAVTGGAQVDSSSGTDAISSAADAHTGRGNA